MQKLADNLGNRVQFNDGNLQAAVNLWYDSKQEATLQYGDINTWDVSRVTNMSNLFSNKLNFNSNIGNWDTSNVTNMENMFAVTGPILDGPYDFYSFNQDIGNWNTSNVTNMRGMFY